MKCFKLWVRLFVVIALCVALIGCGAQQLPSEGKNKDNLSIASLPEELDSDQISVLVRSDIIQETFNDAVKMIQERYGATVNFTMTTSGEQETKIIAAVAAGDPFDCVYWSQNHMPRYAIKNLLQPIEPYFNLSDPLWQDVKYSMDQFKYKGKYYGVSEGAQPFVILFNKTMFENNGLKTPVEYYKEGKWDWNTLRQLGQALTQDTDRDGLVDQWGFFTGAAKEIFLLSNGIDLVNFKDDGSIELMLKDSKVVEALQFYQDSYIKYGYASDIGKWQINFPQGKIGMLGTRISAINKVITQNMKDIWDIAPIPVGPSGEPSVSPSVCGFWGISMGAKNPRGGAALLYFRQKTTLSDLKETLENCTEEQVQLIQQLQKKAKIAKYHGIGNMDDIVNEVWNNLKTGTPVSSVIEQKIPAMQNEIDQMIKDAQ